MKNNKQVSFILKFIVVTLFLLFPAIALGCEPIVPLMTLYSGTLLMGALVMKSFIGLFIAVLIKIVVFAWKSGISNKIKGVIFVILANLYSTIPGILIAIALSAPAVVLFTLPFIFIAFIIPAKELKKYGQLRKLNTFSIAVGLLGIALITIFIFGFSMEFLKDNNYPAYWAAKILYTTIGIGLSFVITIVCEVAIIARLYKNNYDGKQPIMESVIWANIAVFITILGVGALIALPHRFGAPGFLMGWLMSVIG